MFEARLKILVLSATPLAAPFAAGSASTSKGDATMAQLSAADREVANEAVRTEGAVQQQYFAEQRRLEQLIDALKSGKQVDPPKIEHAVDRANQFP